MSIEVRKNGVSDLTQNLLRDDEDPGLDIVSLGGQFQDILESSTVFPAFVLAAESVIYIRLTDSRCVKCTDPLNTERVSYHYLIPIGGSNIPEICLPVHRFHSECAENGSCPLCPDTKGHVKTINLKAVDVDGWKSAKVEFTDDSVSNPLSKKSAKPIKSDDTAGDDCINCEICIAVSLIALILLGGGGAGGWFLHKKFG